MFILKTIPKKKGCFLKGTGKALKSHSYWHLLHQVLPLYSDLMFLFACCMMLHFWVCVSFVFFFPDFGHPPLSISPLQWQGTFTERYNRPEQCCCSTSPPPPPLHPGPKCQTQLVGKLQEPGRTCSTSPNNTESSYEDGYK